MSGASIPVAGSSARAPIAPQTLASFRALVSQRLGLTLPERFDAQFRRALDAAGKLTHAADPESLLAHLTEAAWTSPAWQALIALVTVRETSFFRQKGWWDSITRDALFPLIEARRRDGSRHLRCLSIGCASGDEPYSLAMVIERLLGGEKGWTIEILALDLCQAALDEAKAGVFDARAVNEVPAGDLQRWFRPTGRHRFRLAEELRRRVSFQQFNLAAAAEDSTPNFAPGAPADLVICRNLLIHLQPARQAGVARYLRDQVRPGGRLAVSPVEATPAWFAPMRFHATSHAILFEKPLDTRPAAAKVLKPVAKPAVAPVPRPAPAPRAAPAPRPRRSPSDAAVSLGHVRRLADRGLLAEARRLCDQALDGSEEAHLLMALVCQALGDVAAAQTAALKSRTAAPHSPAAQYVSAIVCLRAGRMHEARFFLGEAVRLLERSSEASAHAARLGIDEGEIRQAARRLGATTDGGGLGRSR